MSDQSEFWNWLLGNKPGDPCPWPHEVDELFYDSTQPPPDLKNLPAICVCGATITYDPGLRVYMVTRGKMEFEGGGVSVEDLPVTFEDPTKAWEGP